MTAILLACTSAVLFGAASVFIRVSLRAGGDPELGAFASILIASVLCVTGALVAGQPVPLDDTWPFFLAGLIAPGVSQVFFFRAIRDAGARACRWSSGWRRSCRS